MGFILHFVVNVLGGWLARHFFVGRKAIVGKGTRLNLFSLVSNASGKPDSVVIGDYGLMFGQLVTEKKGTIAIGHHVEIEPRTVLRAMDHIKVGNYCKIAEMVYIQDNNSHSTNPDERRTELIQATENDSPLERHNVAHAPISIGDDVFIGRRAMIYKGVHIGKASIIAAGAVVTKDIPPYSLAAGNPAQVVKTYKSTPHAH